MPAEGIAVRKALVGCLALPSGEENPQHNAKDVLKRITISALVLQDFFDTDLKQAPKRAGADLPVLLTR